MRGQSLTSLLAYEAKRRPEIQALVDNIMNLSDDQIDAAVVPLLWYKQALKQLRAQGGERSVDEYVNAHTVTGSVADIQGFTAIWEGEQQMMQTGPLAWVEVKHGFPVFFPTTGGVWIDTLFAAQIPVQLHGLTGQPMTRTAYMEVLRDRRNRLL